MFVLFAGGAGDSAGGVVEFAGVEFAVVEFAVVEFAGATVEFDGVSAVVEFDGVSAVVEFDEGSGVFTELEFEVPSAKVQLNVTLDIVTLAALISRPGLQMLIGAHGGVGIYVKTSLVRSPSRHAELWQTIRSKLLPRSRRNADSTPARPKHAHAFAYFGIGL
jgi:hypothetical protein